MGNCQAVDAATLEIQRPSGKVDKLYWPVSAGEVMKVNPGHHVALLLSTTLYHSTTKGAECPNNTSTGDDHSKNTSSVRLTRIKLLRPTDTLALGHVYRLITSQDVMEFLLPLWYFRGYGRAEDEEASKADENQSGSGEKLDWVREEQSSGSDLAQKRSELYKENQGTKNEKNKPRTVVSTNPATARSRTWQPSLKSISEATS
ncbi:hypothetical protein K2173_022747 [Erythroxylum novogranatense]|uniref:Uncharacterized protein n=1 Tax=Erythroxylum novogranatense TaxID=1862640 RepID=A0AAV8SMM2_9ROSI|nr:hypothetical protein K2173_022747 [Erythroxylum novogranatense]